MITVASKPEIARMRESCHMAARVRDELRERIRPGVETRELDDFVVGRLSQLGGQPAFKGYRGYPANICVSVNEEVVHGIPGRRVLKAGDLVSVDMGVLFEGFYADTAVSVVAGSADEASSRLMAVTLEALRAGIRAARAGQHVSDISHVVQVTAERAGYSVVREFVGHGIGRRMHEDPQIPNYGDPGRGQVLVEGQTLAIEPMVNEGVPGVRVLEDGWTAVTADGKRSAHFEHTILVRKGEPEVLTSLDGGV
ncbi:MAG: type I methionyl aminopeptidase [Candidatus Coatesbacteria bacterium]